MSVVSKKIPCYHYLARCQECNWVDSAGSNLDIPRARRNVISHVESTGHTVSVEKANAIIYKRSN